ncbi:MAG: hypothetical protein K0Q59_5202 [Paenibacillus sp.]|nr:hypothetical protein [Paenibacillus sp.]
MLLSVPLLPAELLLVQALIDRIQHWNAPDPIQPILIAAAWLTALLLMNNTVLGAPIPLAMTRLGENGTLEEQRLLLAKTSRLPIADIESAQMNNARERASQLSLSDMYIAGVQLIQTFLHIIVSIAVLLAFNQWVPVLLLVGLLPILLRASGKSASTVEHASRRLAFDRRLLRYYADLMTQQSGAKEIRLFGLGQLLLGRWTAVFERHSSETGKAVRSAQLQRLGTDLIMALLAGLLIALTICMPNAVPMTAGHFALLFMALTKLLAQLPGLFQSSIALHGHLLKWQDFRAYMDLDEQIPHAVPATATTTTAEETRQDAALQVRGLTFRYPQSRHDSLSDVSLSIPHRCRAALVGENGSGKSTLIKLLLGFYTPAAGDIHWGSSTHGANASIVLQDFTKLHITLRENVALGSIAEIGQDNRLRQSLQLAGSKFADLEQQLGTPFGGIEPSGGQWQKIATARAIVRDAGFVVYDEPTAALDPIAEREAFELFLRVTEGRSALLVTHRLGAAKLADRIFVMERGRIVEQGTHEQLMHREGLYSRMYKAQASWYV